MSEITIIILAAIICTTILFCVALYTQMKKVAALEAEALTHFCQQFATMNDNMWEVTTETKEK
nr:MAG TPA: hypothetical protein [Caudoviricetes sp.]